MDRATEVFFAMIAEQKAAVVAGGDHFAAPGANDRVWGALDKFAVLRSSAGNVVAASAEGYAFPTDLDRDQPIGGLAPQTQAELVLQALGEGWTTEKFTVALHDHRRRHDAG